MLSKKKKSSFQKQKSTIVEGAYEQYSSLPPEGARHALAALTQLQRWIHVFKSQIPTSAYELTSIMSETSWM